MQEVRIDHWCDACHQESGTRTAVAARYQISVKTGSRAMERMLELCDVHAKLVEDVREMMRVCGQPVTDDAERGQSGQPELPLADDRYQWRTKRLDCPMCGKNLSESGIRYHLVNAHKVKQITQPKKCPECAYKNGSPTAMGTHRSQAHRYNVVGDMIAQHEAKAAK